MIPKIIKCNNCGASIEVRTWRRHVKCPYCGSRFPFEGFEYRDIDWQRSMYGGVKLWMDCPACRSQNMYLGPSGQMWRCPDCGYMLSEEERRTSMFWFCDECEAYLNVQPGFTTSNKVWRCTECGQLNDVTEEHIL